MKFHSYAYLCLFWFLTVEPGAGCEKGSVQLLLHVSHAWNQVDGATCHNHRWLSSNYLLYCLVNLIGGYVFDRVKMLPQCQCTVACIITGHLFKSVTTVLHRQQKVHLDCVLGTGKFLLIDWVAELVKGVHCNFEKIRGVRSSTGNFDTEKA